MHSYFKVISSVLPFSPDIRTFLVYRVYFRSLIKRSGYWVLKVDHTVLSFFNKPCRSSGDWRYATLTKQRSYRRRICQLLQAANVFRGHALQRLHCKVSRKRLCEAVQDNCTRHLGLFCILLSTSMLLSRILNVMFSPQSLQFTS